MELTENTVIKRNTKLLTSGLDNELVMMSLDKGEYYGLNTIAARIWNLIENPSSLHDVVNHLVEEYDVTREQCFADILPFLKEMLEKQIIEVENELE
jgi:hypothetical protein